MPITFLNTNNSGNISFINRSNGGNMTLTIAPPLPIVTDGLILNLDAGNPSSYPGSGTTWTDLSESGNNGTLTNGPTFSSDNDGSISFDGTNDFISLSNPSLTNQITIEVFIKIDTSNIVTPFVASYVLGRENSYRMLASRTGFSWICATTNNSWYTTGTAIGVTTNVNNIWNHFVGTYDSTKNSLYVNGSLAVTGSTISGNIATAADNFGLMNTHPTAASNVTSCKGLAAIFRIYNRALSASEILRNYNAQKGRFGL